MIRIRGDGRSAAAAILVLVIVVGAALHPLHRSEIADGIQRAWFLPQRLGIGLREARQGLLGPPFGIMIAAQDYAFEDAVIVISDRREDAELASISWCAYYLYPRVLVHPATLDQVPSLEPDFVLITRNFAPGLPDSVKGTTTGIRPVSERAIRHMQEIPSP
jgi:hypothetical protein